MKLKAAITEGAPPELIEAFGSRQFAVTFLDDVVVVLTPKDAADNPAAYYVQKPDTTIALLDDLWGVEVRLTGVSRGGRSAKVFHEALKALERLVEKTIRDNLPADAHVQMFVVLMLDGDVETKPGSGVYSSVLESTPCWVGYDIDNFECDTTYFGASESDIVS